MNALFYRIGLRSKLTLLAVVAMGALLIPARTLWNESGSNLEQAHQEIAGIAPMLSAVHTLGAVRSFRGASLAAFGGIGPRSAMDDARLKAEQAYAELGQSIRDNGLAGLADAVTTRQKRFAAFAQAASAPGAVPLDVAYAGFEAGDDTLALINEVANASTISLDPEATTYFMFDAVANRISPLLEDLGRMRGTVFLLAGHAIDEQVAIGNIELLRRQVTAHLKGVQTALKAASAAGSDAEASKALEDLSASLEASTGKSLAAVDTLLARHGRPGAKSTAPRALAALDSEAVYRQLNDTVALGTALNEKAVGLFGDRLKARVRELEAQRAGIVALVGGLAAILLGLCTLLTLSITLPIKRLLVRTGRIASGDLASDEAQIHGANEMARLMQGLESMRAELSSRLDHEREAAAANQRILAALDCVAVSVMVADADNRIIYCNPALNSMLAHVESDLRVALPNFSASNLLGRSMDEFHVNPAHQHSLVKSLSGAHTADIKVGRLRMRLVMSPILGEDGQCSGTVVQWMDRTAEVTAEDEIGVVIAAAAQGEFSQRIAVEGKTGFFKLVASNINTLLQTASDGLGEVQVALQKLASGDLAHRIERDFAGVFAVLKDDCNGTAASLTRVVTEIRDATSAIATAAKEIAQGNQNLSTRTEQQAASLQETAASMEELTSTVRQNSENAAEADQLAGRAAEVAFAGGQVVQDVVSTMGQIHDSARKVADIIGVIDGIAFQTNILALNAAVEAARAGEQGRGFAVVASEVRNLAQRSATAAKEIKGLIGESVDRVEIGAKQVERAGATMNELVAAVQSVSSLVRQISGASAEQSTGIGQVNIAINNMDEGTQQNAALVEQAAAAAASMAEQAQRLSISVDAFRIDAQAVGAPAVPAATLSHPTSTAAMPPAARKPAQPPRPATLARTASPARPGATGSASSHAPAKTGRSAPSGTPSRPGKTAPSEPIRSLDAPPLDDEWEEF